MVKIVRISDEIHEKLKVHANADRRTINSEAEIIMEMYFSDAEGGLTSEQVARSRVVDALAVKEHIVNEGKELGILTDTPLADDVINKLPTPKKIETAVPRDKEILKEINTLQAAINGADPMNQDPDYWDSIHEKEKRVQELWGEWHTETGQ